jgi:hypothetical protein
MIEHLLFAAVGSLLVTLGYLIGRRTQRRSIVKDYDEIIYTIRQMMLTKRWADLDRFLHELCEDTPYVPTMSALASQYFAEGQQPRREKTYE